MRVESTSGSAATKSTERMEFQSWSPSGPKDQSCSRGLPLLGAEAPEPPPILTRGLVPVQLSQTAAHDYNPFGTGPENRDLIQNVVDGDPNTTWSTETYYEGTLRKAGGVGAGLYLDASPGVAAKAIEFGLDFGVAEEFRVGFGG